jgi:glycerophosphoryl diester phosphodiesterase
MASSHHKNVRDDGHGRGGEGHSSSSINTVDENTMQIAHRRPHVTIGPRAYYLIESLEEEDDDTDNSVTFKRPGLKDKLRMCTRLHYIFRTSDFVIGHRGAALQFPEHSAAGHDAASRMGAGIVECDVNLTKDKKLICRHDRCDLHLTTDVLLRPTLAKKCTRQFQPAASGGKENATAKCCTTDFTLEEIQSMCGKMTSENPYAKTVAEYISHTPNIRTELYTRDCPHIQSHADYMKVVDGNGGSFTPEVKMLDWDFVNNNEDKDGMSDKEIIHRQAFIDQIVASYKDINPNRVYFQSFVWEDIYYLVKNHHPALGVNAFALDGNYNVSSYTKDELRKHLQPLVDNGVTTVAPAIFALLDIHATSGNIVPSLYATVARDMGLGIVTWTFERSEVPLANGGGFYYTKLAKALRSESDMIKILDVLYEDVGVKGIFTDWPSMVTFYANCREIAIR